MNKKAQYHPPQPSYTSVHPVLIIGIGIFILPFILPITGINSTSTINNIFSTIGLIAILVGGTLSIFKASN